MQTWRKQSSKHLRREWWLLLPLLGGVLLLTLAYQLPRVGRLSAALPPAALPQQGMHAVERMGVNEDGLPFRWSTGEATLHLPNPGDGPLLLRMLMAAPPAGRNPPLELHGPQQSLPPFTVTDGLRFYTVLLRPQPLGERLRLDLETDSFREDLGRRKERRLGVMLSDLSLAAPRGGWPPLALVVALATGSVASYALLRRASLTPAHTALVVCGATLVVALVQQGGAWQWALTGRLLWTLTLGAVVALLLDGYLLPLISQATRQPNRQAGEADTAAIATTARIAPRASRVFVYPWLTVMPWLCLLCVLWLAVRVPWVAAPDPVGDLELSARRTAQLAAQGLAGAYGGTGGNDYLPLRLYLLWGLGGVARLSDIALATPLNPAANLLLKLPWLLADLATMLLIWSYALRRQSLASATWIAGAYALAPQIWLNASWWGQIDALLVLLMVLALLGLRRGPRWGWAALSFALLVKLQAIIMLPLFAVLTLRRYEIQGLVRGASVAGLLLALGATPLVAAGHTPDLIEAYLGSVGRFNGVTINAYNIWYFVAPGIYVPDTNAFVLGLNYRQVGLLLLASAALLISLLVARSDEAGFDTIAAALTALAFFLLPTQIHERYLFLCFAFLALSLPHARALWLPFALLSLSATLNVFGTLDFWRAIRPVLAPPVVGKTFAVVNLLIFGALLVWLARQVFPTSYRALRGRFVKA
jgi:Gpi18-like mannosyltransferase